MTEFFRLSGRVNRLKYFAYTLVITVVCYAAAFWLGLLVGLTGGTDATASFLGGVLGLGANVLIAFQVVRRLHDLDRPGWQYWLLLIPFYNIYLGLVLYFVKGTDGSNSYGEDPLTKSAVPRSRPTEAAG